MQVPVYADVIAARKFISPYLPKTPLVRIQKLSEALDCEYYVKLENLQPVGAFKVRGGVNLVGHLRAEGGNETLVTASTGNHGQSIAYAGRIFNTRVIIYAPAENVNPAKLQAMRDLGAEVRLHGRDFDEARVETERVAAAEGFRYVHSADEPKLIAGVGTIGLEIFEDLAEVDVIIAPAGGGSCASGNCIVAHELNPGVKVIAVERLFVATLDHDLIAVAKHEGAKAVPLRLKKPLALSRQLGNALRQHRQDRRVHRKLHKKSR